MMQDVCSLSEHLLTVPVSVLAGQQVDAHTASDPADGPDMHESSLETLRCAAADLLHAVNGILQERPQEAREYLLHAAALLRLRPPNTIAGADGYDEPAAVRPPRGGLAPWQVRKLTAYIEMHLGSAIAIVDLAALAKLSTFHFCRAFRQSLNETPRTYVMRRRVERAQGLMFHPDASLARIAIDCGFADQAHFNKVFRRIVGESPGAWRRARATAPR
jgi:AraC-like DNA-binding protein